MTLTQSSAFGALLRRYRLAAGLTQEALAEQSGLSAAAIRSLELGIRQSPHRDTVVLLATALRLSEAARAALEATVKRQRGPAGAPVAALAVTESPAQDAPEWSAVLAPPTPLIGRDADVAAVAHLLQVNKARLVTLTGPGGVGKTRLALEVANTVRDQYAAGVVVVNLAPLRDAALVASAIARALGVQEAGGQTMREALLAFLREKHVLLVLDNVEQVLAARSLLVQLQVACPFLTMLLTSRAALRVRGEQQVPVRPLAVPAEDSLPPLEALAPYPAIALFLDRARAVKPDFALTETNAATVRAICARLDGLPLAIELAAAHMRLRSPAALLTRLEHRLTTLTAGPLDLPRRQQTMRDAIAWSYDLLDAAEQALFRRLAVFAGGCTVEAIEQVCHMGAALMDPLAGRDVVDTLADLVDKSLLRVEEGDSPARPAAEVRVWMLETLREYGLEQLTVCGESEVLQRAHAVYYLARAEEAEPELTGPAQATWLARLEEEHGNVRAALGWARESGEVELGLRLAGALWRFWYVRGYLGEGRMWLEGLLALEGSMDTGGAVPARAKALHGAGVLAYSQGDYARAVALGEECVAAQRALGDAKGVANALNMLGSVALEQANYGRATVLYEECLALRRDIADIGGIAATLTNLGHVMRYRGDFIRAAALHEESLALYRQLGNTWAIAAALANWGDVARQQGAYARAVALSDESLTLFRDLGDKPGIALALISAAEAALGHANAIRAATLCAESLRVFQELGDKHGRALALTVLGAIAQAQGDPEGATALLREGMILHQEVGNQVGVVECLEGLAGVACTHGQEDAAVRLLGSADVVREAVGAPVSPADRALYDRTVADARAALGEIAFAAAWTAGHTLPLAQAITEALDSRGQIHSEASGGVR